MKLNNLMCTEWDGRRAILGVGDIRGYSVGIEGEQILFGASVIDPD